MFFPIFCLFIFIFLYLSKIFFMKNKLDPFMFECGMDPLSELNLPLLMHFFFIAILFLIFDVELALSIPLISFSLQEKVWNLFWVIFFMILFSGLIFEFFMGTLEWKE